MAQDTVTVAIDPRLWEGPHVFFSGTINGVTVTTADTLLKVPLAGTFDTIVNKGAVALCRMKPGKRYLLRFNPCSSYEFLPARKPKVGMLKARIFGQDTSQYELGFSILRPVGAGERDRYYYELPSSMCVFSRKRLRLEKGYENVVAKYPFHFLHGEKLTLHYNVETGASWLTLDGYTFGTRYQRKRVYYGKS